MKNSILTTFLFLFSLSSFAVDDCLRYMTNAKKAQIVMKKDCSLVIQDSGKEKIASMEGCFTKIKNQFGNKTSWGFVADIQKQSGYVSKDVIIINTVNAKETSKKVSINLKTASPELFKRYQTNLEFNKETQELSLKRDEGFFSLNNKYQFKLQCK